MLGYSNKVWLLSGFLKQQEKIKYLGALEDKMDESMREREVVFMKMKKEKKMMQNFRFFEDI